MASLSKREQTLLPSSKGKESSPSTIIAKTFYRRTGNRFLRPDIKISNSYDHEIWGIFLPAFIALLMEPVQTFIEFSIVGHLGNAPLGAVGLGTIIFQFTVGFFATFIFATTPIISRFSATKNAHGASKATAQGIWIALFTGFALQFLVLSMATDICAYLSSDSYVATLAEQYLRTRSYGIPAAFVMMVVIGAARGHREMSAQLVGSATYGIVLSILDLVLVFGFNFGITGAGIAAATSQWISAVAITLLLVHRGHLALEDVFSLGGVFPHVNVSNRRLSTHRHHLKKLVEENQVENEEEDGNDFNLGDLLLSYITMAPSLALNSVAGLAPMLYATSLATHLGTDQLAAHTVLRQLTGFWLQGFLTYNVTAHTMVASSLGHTSQTSSSSRGMERASGALERICQVAVVSSIPAACILFAVRFVVPSAFTSDVAVIDEVTAVLPFLLVYLPLDALGTALEGGILGASDTKWIAGRTVVASVVSVAALSMVVVENSLVGLWMCVKMTNFVALSLDLARFMGPVAKKRKNVQ